MTATASPVSRPSAPLKAEQILAIPLTQPERLYTGRPDTLGIQYKTLAKIWHPDLNKSPKAADVFAHIAALHEKAKDNLDAGIWHIPGLLTLSATNGKKYEIRYLKSHEFELGEMYIAKSLVAYCVRPEFKDLFDNAEKTIKNFPYPDDKVRHVASEFLPNIKASFSTSDRHVLVVEKRSDLVLLQDLIDYVDGKIEPKHTAWMMSRMHGIACYLQIAKLTHNAIAPDTLFVSPEMHTAALLGGWWYATPEMKKMKALPVRTLDLMPPDVLAKKKASTRVDLELVRATGRELLGDLVGSTLKWNKDVPKPLSEWLNLPTSGDANRDHHAWSEDVLLKSFGPKRFVKLDVKPEDIYPQP